MKKKAPAELGRQALREQKTQWDRWCRPMIERPVSAEAVHGLRVAGRRLRAAIKIFRDVLPAQAARLDQPLRQIGERLGSVRDLDVHLSDLSNRLVRWPVVQRAALGSYRDYLRRQRAQFSRRVAGRIHSVALRRLSRALDHLADSTARVSRSAPSPRQCLKKQWRRLRRASAAVKSHPTDDALHQLRRRIRRLRYAAEFFQPVALRSVKGATRRLVAWQDLLGDRQDRLAGSKWVERYLAQRRRAIPAGEERALLRLVRQLDDEKEGLKEKILLGWGKPQRRAIKQELLRAF